jgi:hypothetical protein
VHGMRPPDEEAPRERFGSAYAQMRPAHGVAALVAAVAAPGRGRAIPICRIV